MKKNWGIILGIIIVIIVTCIGIGYLLNARKEAKSNNEKLSDTIGNITVEIKEGTLTKTGATLVIINASEEICLFDEEYTIEQKQNGEWKMATIPRDGYIEAGLLRGVMKGKRYEFKIDWSDRHGKLKSGEYRIITKIYQDQVQYASIEFTI